ncbi:universal stress protein [Algibacter sp. Ld11]|uniref:universal stress protein n=1 Tax=Algibacter sp. Ld11 TaxID=649150 RepID=UPI003863615D
MANNRFKILVLSDLKKHTSIIIKSAVSLSKMINADVDLFHVKKPTDVVASDSQLSAMRSLNQEHNKSRNKIKETIAPLNKAYNINITSNFGIGNVKSEIEDYIKATKPDVIVLGKRSSKALKLIGDNITDFVLKTYEGPVFIAANKNGIDPETELNIGLLNGKSQAFNQAFLEDVLTKTTKPLKSFNIVSSKAKVEETSVLREAVNYVFEKNDNTINKLAEYLEKNHVNLLFVNRTDSTNNSANNKSEIKSLINNVNVSLFITGSVQKWAV